MKDESTKTFHIGGCCLRVYEVQHYLDPSLNQDILAPQAYADEAIVPRIAEGDPSFESIPFSMQSYRDGRDVLVSSFDTLSLEDIDCITSKVSTMSKLTDLTSDASYQSTIGKMTNFVERISKFGSNIEVLGVLLSPAGFFTTTYDFDKKQYLGLHVDNWDNGSLAERRSGRQRLILNVSAEPRVFMYSKIAIDELGIDWDSNSTPTSLIQQLGQSGFGGMHYVILPPAWFCISPTENLVHDGCTLWTNLPGIALTALFDVDQSKLVLE